MSTDVFHLLDILGVHLYPSVFSRGSRNVQQAGPLLLAAIAIHMDVFHLLDILGAQRLNLAIDPLNPNAEKI